MSVRGRIDFTWFQGRWIPIAETGTALTEWFISDIGLGGESMDWLLAELTRIERGESEPPSISPEGVLATRNSNYLGTGNAFSMFASPTLFYLQDYSGAEPRVIMTVAQLRAVVANYRSFLDHGCGDQLDPPPAFEFEFLAEGDDARRLADDAGLLSTKH